MSLSSLELPHASAWRHVWRATRAIRAVWMRYRRHQRLRRDLAQLAAMDDLSLKDIGISRTEVRGAIREGTDLGGRGR
jgi:uncharacterized protein YjiS (DUF1127 family)